MNMKCLRDSHLIWVRDRKILDMYGYVQYNVHKKEVDTMLNINITNLRKKLFEYINQAIEFNDVINVNTKSGNAVIISEEDYNSLMETLYISNNPATKQEIIEGMNTPIDECISENEVDW